MKKIDDIDRDLVEYLLGDPQISAKDLARQIGIVEKTVVSRLSALAEENLLRVTIQWDMHALGLDVVGHLFLHAETHDLSRLGESLANIPEIIICSEVMGWPGIYCFLVTKSLEEFYSVCNKLESTIPGLTIEEKEITAKIIKYDTSYGGGLTTQNWIPDFNSLEPRVKIDEFDMSLTELMLDDARISNRELARQLDVSESMVRQRLKKLNENGCLRKGTVFHPLVFNYEFGALVRIKLKGGQPENICEALHADDDVAMVMKVVGKFDLMALVFGDNIHSVSHKLNTFFSQYPEVVRYNVLPVTTIHKYTYGLASF